MKTTLNALAATALVASSGVALAQLTDCDVDVSRTRIAEEKVCYAEHGPQSAAWDVRWAEELEACLRVAHTRHKFDRMDCQEMTSSEAKDDETS